MRSTECPLVIDVIESSTVKYGVKRSAAFVTKSK